MAPNQRPCTDDNSPQIEDNILQLAEDFDIPASQLNEAMQQSHALMEHLRTQKTKPASKATIGKLEKALANAIGLASGEGVVDRLSAGAAATAAIGINHDHAVYVERHKATDQIRDALRAMRDLQNLITVQKTFELRAGRPGNDAWKAAIQYLRDFWIYDLEREESVSGHPDDATVNKPSYLVRFVHQAMLALGEEITEQSCRTALLNLRDAGHRTPFEPKP